MSDHIFISYASENYDFAIQLADDIERFFSVWIDREKLRGGVQWEQDISNAIQGCSLFLVIVSNDSNQSAWVTRETIHAENLGKFRVPVLLDGELPLRLLELQYVDFRADYEGGFSDLLEALRLRVDTVQTNVADVDKILGGALRAWLDGNIPTADSLFNQAMVIYPDLRTKLTDFRASLVAGTRGELLAATLTDKIAILETARLSASRQYGDNPAYEWSLQVEADPAVIDQIDHVRYQLHETFANPLRVVRDRASNFRLDSIGWGVFDVPIEIHFVDGSIGTTEHELTFDSAD